MPSTTIKDASITIKNALNKILPKAEFTKYYNDEKIELTWEELDNKAVENSLVTYSILWNDKEVDVTDASVIDNNDIESFRKEIILKTKEKITVLFQLKITITDQYNQVDSYLKDFPLITLEPAQLQSFTSDSNKVQQGNSVILTWNTLGLMSHFEIVCGNNKPIRLSSADYIITPATQDNLSVHQDQSVQKVQMDKPSNQLFNYSYACTVEKAIAFKLHAYTDEHKAFPLTKMLRINCYIPALKPERIIQSNDIYSIAVTSDNQQLYVATNDAVLVIDTNKKTTLKKIKMHSGLKFMALVNNTELYVINADTRTFDTITLGNYQLKHKPGLITNKPVAMAVTKDGKKVFLATDQGIIKLDLTSDNPLDKKEDCLQQNIVDIQISENGSDCNIYLITSLNDQGILIQLDKNLQEMKSGRTNLGKNPHRLAFNKQLNNLYVTNSGDNSISIVGQSILGVNSLNEDITKSNQEKIKIYKSQDLQTTTQYGNEITKIEDAIKQAKLGIENVTEQEKSLKTLQESYSTQQNLINQANQLVTSAISTLQSNSNAKVNLYKTLADSQNSVLQNGTTNKAKQDTSKKAPPEIDKLISYYINYINQTCNFANINITAINANANAYLTAQGEEKKQALNVLIKSTYLTTQAVIQQVKDTNQAVQNIFEHNLDYQNLNKFITNNSVSSTDSTLIHTEVKHSLSTAKNNFENSLTNDKLPVLDGEWKQLSINTYITPIYTIAETIINDLTKEISDFKNQIKEIFPDLKNCEIKSKNNEATHTPHDLAPSNTSQSISLPNINELHQVPVQKKDEKHEEPVTTSIDTLPQKSSSTHSNVKREKKEKNKKSKKENKKQAAIITRTDDSMTAQVEDNKNIQEFVDTIPPEFHDPSAENVNHNILSVNPKNTANINTPGFYNPNSIPEEEEYQDSPIIAPTNNGVSGPAEDERKYGNYAAPTISTLELSQYCQNPEGIICIPESSSIYVAGGFKNTVVQIRLDNTIKDANESIKAFPVGLNPFAVLYASSQKVFVACSDGVYSFWTVNQFIKDNVPYVDDMSKHKSSSNFIQSLLIHDSFITDVLHLEDEAEERRKKRDQALHNSQLGMAFPTREAKNDMTDPANPIQKTHAGLPIPINLTSTTIASPLLWKTNPDKETKETNPNDDVTGVQSKHLEDLTKILNNYSITTTQNANDMTLYFNGNAKKGLWKKNISKENLDKVKIYLESILQTQKVETNSKNNTLVIHANDTNINKVKFIISVAHLKISPLTPNKP